MNSHCIALREGFSVRQLQSLHSDRFGVQVELRQCSSYFRSATSGADLFSQYNGASRSITVERVQKTVICHARTQFHVAKAYDETVDMIPAVDVEESAK